MRNTERDHPLRLRSRVPRRSAPDSPQGDAVKFQGRARFRQPQQGGETVQKVTFYDVWGTLMASLGFLVTAYTIVGLIKDW